LTNIIMVLGHYNKLGRKVSKQQNLVSALLASLAAEDRVLLAHQAIIRGGLV
jgi:hypothetical protein